MDSKYVMLLLVCLMVGLALIGPAMAASNGQIAFVSERDGNPEIYVMPASGETGGVAATRLTNNPEPDRDPAWSPDGTKIAFTSSDTGGLQGVYVMKADGTNRIRLSDSTLDGANPAWSPDGSKIAFSSGRDGDAEIFVMPASGENGGIAATQITHNDGATAMDRQPTWSPDGTKIAFESDRKGDLNVFVINADGTNEIDLTGPDGLFSMDSDWSPDGTTIVFSSMRFGENFAICEVPSDGDSLDIARLTFNQDYGDHHPSYSPDGTQIVFASWRGAGIDIFVMPASGETGGVTATRLTTNAARDEQPVWGGDMTAPVIASTAPANGATGVGTDPEISVVFSEPITFSELDPTMKITVAAGSGTGQWNYYDQNLDTLRFGDSTGSAWLAPGTTYTVTIEGIRDRAGNPMGAPYTWTFTTAAAKPPIGRITAFPASGLAPLTVRLDASASSDPDGTIASYVWNFGDGSTGSGVSVRHTYTRPGTYAATLTLTDNDGATSTAAVSITVKTPVQAVLSLRAQVNSYGLPRWIVMGLSEKLDGAVGALRRGNERAAVNILNAFIRQAKAQTGKGLPPAKASALIGEAQKIIRGIQAA